MKLHLPPALRSALMMLFPASILACSATLMPTAAAAGLWDDNWGEAGLDGAPAGIDPDHVLTDLAAGYTCLAAADSAYFADGVVVAQLAGTAQGATNVFLIGGGGSVADNPGAGEGPVEAYTWLEVTGGTYRAIVGGSYAQNYNGGPVSAFTGNSHILLTATDSTSPTVGYIIGGNYKDGQSAPFNGNSYISVMGGQVIGSIVGAGTSAHLATAVFNGDSNVWIYTPLSSSGSSLHDLPNDLIIGGSAGIANVTPRLVQQGNSSVHVDLTGVTPATGNGGAPVSPTMAKLIIGGAWLKGGTNSTQSGSSLVSIAGTVAGGTAATFSKQVIAGTYLAGGGTGTLGGNSTLSIVGGNYNSYVVGGNFHQSANGTSRIGGNVEMGINGGNFTSFVTAGSFTNSSGGNSTIDGDIQMAIAGATFSFRVSAGGVVGGAGGTHVVSGGTQLTVDSGTFNSDLAAGFYFHANGGSATIGGGTQLTVEDGTFNGMVMGGNLQVQRGSSSTIEGGTALDLRGGSYNNAIIGGSFVTANDATPSRSSISGTTSITLGEAVQTAANARVIGGSYDNTGATDISTGEVIITVNGGSYAGDFIGGSYITGQGGAVNVQHSGDISIIVNGGTLSGTLYGGSYTSRGAATSVNEQGDISISLAGGTVNGNVYAGGGVALVGDARTPAAAGVQSGSTSVEVGNAVTLGTITISGGVENGNDASRITGDRTLLLSGTEAYTNLGTVQFRDFNVIDAAADATISLLDSDAALTKRGTGTLTIYGAGSDLHSIDSLNVSAGAFDSGTAWMTNNNDGLSAITLGTGAAFRTSGLMLEDSALLTLDVTGAPADALVRVAGTGSLTLAGAKNLRLELSGVESLFPGQTATLLTWNNDDTPFDLANVDWVNSGNYGPGYELSIVDKSLVLSVSTDGVYVAGDGAEATAVSGYQNFGAYQSVAVMPGETLSLTLDGAPDGAQEGEGALVNNLLGAEGSSFVVENSATDGSVAVVILNNEKQTIVPIPGGLPGDPEGADTLFAGDIRTEGGSVEFIKRGAGTLTVSGSMQAGQLRAQAGTLRLAGDGSALESLSLEGGTVQLGGETARIGTLEDTAAGGSLLIEDGSTLRLTGDSALAAARIGSSGQGVGRLLLEGGLALQDAAQLDGVALELAQGSLSLGNTGGQNVVALDGVGTVNGNSEASALSVTGQGGSYGGTLGGAGTLTVEQGASQNFVPAFTGGVGWNLVNKGQMLLDGDVGNGRNASFTLKSLMLAPGSATQLHFNSDAPAADLLRLDSLEWGQGARLTLSSSGMEEIVADKPYIIGSVSGGQQAGVLGKVELADGNAAFLLLDQNATTLSVDGAGNLVLNFVSSRVNKLLEMADNPNSATGAIMLWDAATKGGGREDSDLRGLLDALGSEQDTAAANRALAAAAGAGTSVLGLALAGDVERQLRAIRNRTTSMGVNPRVVHDEMPYVNAWVNAEGDYRKMDAAGMAPGYELSSWGGTLGVDIDCTEMLTAGLALTAMYGDLDAESADHASGDLDSYYLSAFARLNSGHWLHTLVATAGMVDVSLDRYVGLGSSSYHTHGETDGFAFGLLYELGYTIPLDEEGTSCLQPLVNVAWRHVGLDSYTESGSDAALRVNGKDVNLVTFGAGARFQAQVGESVYNRSSLLELRALAKVDAGDREGEAAVALLQDGVAGGRVRSAEAGNVGAEFGAGLSIPLGQESGTLFFDASLEWRRDYSQVNGVVGYRVNF